MTELKIDAVITKLEPFTIKESNTEMVKLTIMILPDLIQDEFYMSPTRAKEVGILEPSATEVVKLSLGGSPFRLRVKSVTYTGKTLSTSVK